LNFNRVTANEVIKFESRLMTFGGQSELKSNKGENQPSVRTQALI